MLLPSTSVDSLDAIIDTIDAQLISAHSYDTAVLEVGRMCDSIVFFHVPLVGDP